MAEGISLGKAYVQIMPSAQGISGSITQALGDLSGVGTDAGNSLGGALTVAVGTMLANLTQKLAQSAVEAAKYAVNVGMSFDSAMSQVAATMGTTVNQITALGDKARELGATTAFTATEAAQGLNILAMAGLNAEEQMDAISTVLDLASAGALTLEASASYVTGAVKGFADEMSNAQYYADLMAKGATLANTSVSGFGEALSGTAATVSAYGQSADSVTVALLRLAEQNVTGSEAATALSRAMMDLYTPTDTAQKALDKLGISAYTSTGEAKDFNEVVDDLSGALAGMSDAEANALKNTIFTTYGLQAFNKMTVTSADKVAYFSDQLGASLGSAAQQAQTQLDNLKGDATLFTSAMDGLSTALYDTFKDSLRGVVQLGTDFVGQLQTALETDGPAGMAQAAASIAGSLIQGLAARVPEIASRGMDAAISMIESLGDGLRDGIPALLAQALPMLLEFSANLRANAGRLVDAGIDLVMNLADGLIASLPELIATVPQIVTNIANIINDNAPKLLMAGAQLIVKLAAGLVQAIPALVENLPQIIEAIVAVFQAFNWIDLGKNIITMLSNGIRAMVSTVQSAATGIFTTIKNAIASLPSHMLSIGQSAVQSLSSGIQMLLYDAQMAGVSVFQTVLSALASLPSALLSLAKSAMTSFVGAMQAAISGAGAAARGLLNGIISNITSLPSRALSIIRSAITGIINAFTSINWGGIGSNIINGIIGGIGSAVAGLVDSAVNAAKSAFNAAKSALGIHSPSRLFRDEIGRMIPQGMAAGIEADAGQVADAAGQLAQTGIGACFADLAAPLGDPLQGALLQSRLAQSFDRADSPAAQTANVTLNVYGAQGQDVRELAEIVMDRIQSAVLRKEAAFA